jgi:hypothetical protein
MAVLYGALPVGAEASQCEGGRGVGSSDSALAGAIDRRSGFLYHKGLL